MKKLLLFTAILFASITMGNAQNEKPDYQRTGHQSVTQGINGNASTQLTIVLNPIQSISVNTSNVSLVYTTVSDYENGVSSGKIENHLQIYSTGGYKVNVGYSGVSDTGNGTDANQMFESVNVAVTKKSGVVAHINDTKLQPLTETRSSIISYSKGAFNQMFDVDYQGAKSDADGVKYMDNVIGGGQRTYTATVTYTITPS